MNENTGTAIEVSARKIFDNFISEIVSNEVELFSPPHKMKEDDKEIARIDDPFIRKLFGLFTMYLREAEMLKAQARFEPDNEELHDKCHKAEYKSDCLKHLFWMLCRERYDVRCVENISLRKDWVLVDEKEDPMRGLPPGLRGLIMGGPSNE